MNQKMNVLMATDDNYVLPTTVVIDSIMKHLNKEIDCYVYILVPTDLQPQSKQLFNRLKQIYSMLTIIIVDMGEACQDIPLTIAHISKQTYYRLVVADYLLDLDRCLYLDGDVIVTKDLWPIYQTDLNNAYLAGVKHPNFATKIRPDLCKLLSINTMSQYINAGVLLLNLDKIRRDKMADVFLELCKKGFPMQDQDVINSACYNNMIFLPWRYNIVITALHLPDYLLRLVYPKKEYIKILENGVVFHFAGKVKPWNDNQCQDDYYNFIWWKEVKGSAFFEDIKLCYGDCSFEEYNYPYPIKGDLKQSIFYTFTYRKNEFIKHLISFFKK